MNVTNFFKRHTSTILTVISAAGVVITAMATAKAALKADSLIKEAQEKKGEELTKAEIVKAAAPAYIPPAVTGVLTVCCMFGANILSQRQQAMLTSAYAVVNRAYGDYKNKVKEIYGEEAHKDILRKIAAEKSTPLPIYAATFAENTCLDFDDSEEEKLFYDTFSDRYFQSTFSRVLQAEYHLNRNYVLGADVTLNDFYTFLGIDTTDFGETVGWSYTDGIQWLDFDHTKTVMDDGLECFIIDMVFPPEADEDGIYFSECAEIQSRR
ncbi:MAG: DUF6353 family protein [Ruminococcus sp.]|nr:DUF6353 family protein [Ruminococcus sp.]